MFTKLLVIVLSVSFFSVAEAAKLDQAYFCEAELPKGEALVVIRNKKVLSEVSVNFFNEALDREIPGDFKFNSHNFDPKKPYIVADGLYKDGKSLIMGSIQGSLIPSDNDQVTLMLMAGGDHRIEYGFGNRLTCEKLEIEDEVFSVTTESSPLPPWAMPNAGHLENQAQDEADLLCSPLKSLQVGKFTYGSEIINNTDSSGPLVLFIHTATSDFQCVF